MAKGFTTIALRDALIARLDSFIERNEWGYSNRAEVVTAAVRKFLEQDGEPVVTLSALRAVASTQPKTVDDLLAALLAELDMTAHGRPRFRDAKGQVAHGAQAGTSRSNSESTKRR